MTRKIETTTPLTTSDSIIFPSPTIAPLESERLCPGDWTRIGEACYQFVTEEWVLYNGVYFCFIEKNFSLLHSNLFKVTLVLQGCKKHWPLVGGEASKVQCDVTLPNWNKNLHQSLINNGALKNIQTLPTLLTAAHHQTYPCPSVNYFSLFLTSDLCLPSDFSSHLHSTSIFYPSHSHYLLQCFAIYQHLLVCRFGNERSPVRFNF